MLRNLIAQLTSHFDEAKESKPSTAAALSCTTMTLVTKFKERKEENDLSPWIERLKKGDKEAIYHLEILFFRREMTVNEKRKILAPYLQQYENIAALKNIPFSERVGVSYLFYCAGDTDAALACLDQAHAESLEDSFAQTIVGRIFNYHHGKKNEAIGVLELASENGN